MKYIDMHAHMVSRTTDDYQQMALTGCLAVTEPAFWAGYDRRSADVFADFAAAVAAMPERERERRRRVAALEGARLDDTHPPTAMRIELLESRPRHEPAVVLDDEGSKAIDAELAARQADFQRELVEDYRDSLYA